MSRNESAFRHGMRVRLGSLTGPKGTLYHCERRDGSATYWRVRLANSREWVPPDAFGPLIVEGVGDAINPECASCGLAFVMRAGSGALLCARCEGEQFGESATRDHEFQAYHRRAGYQRRRAHS